MIATTMEYAIRVYVPVTQDGPLLIVLKILMIALVILALMVEVVLMEIMIISVNV